MFQKHTFPSALDAFLERLFSFACLPLSIHWESKVTILGKKTNFWLIPTPTSSSSFPLNSFIILCFTAPLAREWGHKDFSLPPVRPNVDSESHWHHPSFSPHHPLGTSRGKGLLNAVDWYLISIVSKICFVCLGLPKPRFSLSLSNQELLEIIANILGFIRNTLLSPYSLGVLPYFYGESSGNSPCLRAYTAQFSWDRAYAGCQQIKSLKSILRSICLVE